MAMRRTAVRVLVVEEFAAERLLLVNRLRDLGVEEVLATGGLQTALDLARGPSAVDVVLCTIKGPDLQALELIRRLGEHAVDASLVLVAGCHQALVQSACDLARGYGLAVGGVLERPIVPERLRAVMEAAVPAPPDLHVVHDPPPPGRLARALVDGSLGAEFQPQVALDSGCVVGAEALLRWVGPEPPQVTPRTLVATLEAAGQMGRLTRTMLQRAAEEVVRWGHHGRRMRVSVNISATLLDDVGLVEEWVGVVADARAPADLITLELTEDALVTDLSVAMQVLDRLGEAGFHLAMDDFGTGYSTLSLLGALPLTELKVDRSLIQGVADDWRRQAMVDSVLRLCQRLGLRSVAEGVETHEDLAVLRDLGCDIAQGWLFAPAMSWADFADFVERDEPRLVTGPAAVARGSIGA